MGGTDSETWWVKVKGTVTDPVMHRAAPTQKCPHPNLQIVPLQLASTEAEAAERERERELGRRQRIRKYLTVF